MNDVQASVSAALKMVSPFQRKYRARRFAARMRAAEARVRAEGTRIPGGSAPALPRGVLNALCFGVGDEHNRRMIQAYKDAAAAAERFDRARSRR